MEAIYTYKNYRTTRVDGRKFRILHRREQWSRVQDVENGEIYEYICTDYLHPVSDDECRALLAKYGTAMESKHRLWKQHQRKKNAN